MKTPNTLLAAVLALLAAISTAHATVRYVNANSATPTPPYTNHIHEKEVLYENRS